MDFEMAKQLLEYGVIVGLFIFTYFHNLKTSKAREEQMRQDAKEQAEIQRQDAKDRETRIMQESEEREEKLYATLAAFSEKYDLIHKDIQEIKEEIKKK